MRGVHYEKTAIVTGASRGIGRETALLLSQNGYEVFDLSRSGESSGGIRNIKTDLGSEEDIKRAFEEIFKERERLDLLVNNAGFGISGAVEFTSTEDAKRLFDVNFFAPFICSREAVKYLRNSDNPHIINISSAAALFPLPFQAFYSASKAAVYSLSTALSGELRPFGIRVNTVMPGDSKTGFTANREKSFEGAKLYGERIVNSVSLMEKDEQGGFSPKLVAETVLKIARSDVTGGIYIVGGKYKFLASVSNILPEKFKNKVLFKMYGG